MRTYASVVGIMLVAATASAQVPVHVVQPAGQFEDQALKERRDSTKELINALKGKKTVALVEDPSQATILLEVIDRGLVENGSISPDLFATLYKNTDANVVISLKVGDCETKIVGNGGDYAFGAWKYAAKAAAGKIETWIKRNSDKLAK